MHPNKKFDLAVVSLLIMLGAGLSLIFSLKPLVGGFISLLPPALYLILREKKNLLKIALAVIVFGMIFGFVFDFIATLNEAWIVTQLVFPVRIFGFYPLLDDIIGFILMTLLIVVFYEHFLDDEKNRKISKNFLVALIPSSIVLVFVLIAYLINPSLLKIPYVYLVMGLSAIVFPIFAVLYKPKLLGKFLKIAAFFFGVWLIIELVILKTGGWIFPGYYIGQVELFGLKFPFEELFFWMLFYASTVVAYYEFFIDDKK